MRVTTDNDSDRAAEFRVHFDQHANDLQHRNVVTKFNHNYSEVLLLAGRRAVYGMMGALPAWTAASAAAEAASGGGQCAAQRFRLTVTE